MSNSFMNLFAKIGLAAMACASIGFLGCDDKDDTAAPEKTLKLYMPSEYMSDDFIPDFEEQYDAKVIVEFFENNEEMFEKVKSGDKYDVVIPSDYMIERMLSKKLLQTIDKNAMTNLNELSDAVKNLSFDPNNNYSIPYFWGNTGIVYNKNTDGLADDVKAQGFNVFRNTKYQNKIYFYDSERDSFTIALKALGYSANTEDLDELEEAYQWLIDMKDEMHPEFVTDEVIDGMSDKNTQKVLAIVYSGDAASILNANSKMDYWVPESGTNVWYDSMVIPANAENPSLANKFINYAISYDAALKNTEAVGYTSPNAKAYNKMISKGGVYETNKAYQPRSGNENDEIFHDNDTIFQKVKEYWNKVKAH